MNKETYTLLSLQDVINYLEDNNSDLLTGISTVAYYKNWLNTSPVGLNTSIKGLSDVWNLTIYRHIDDYCARYNTPSITATPEEVTAIKNDAVRKFLIALANVMNFTYEKYSLILDAYDVSKTDLLAGVKSTVEAYSSGANSGDQRFNDTPQNENTGGIYNGDNYNTTVTKSSGTSSATATETRFDDRELLIDRLEKIGNKYESILLRWSNEFNKLFMMEVNYER